MTPATKALLTAFADAHRREAAAREAAATATREAREAARLQVALLDELRASGVKLSSAVRKLSLVLGEPLEIKRWQKVSARFRKRRQRGRSAEA